MSKKKRKSPEYAQVKNGNEHSGFFRQHWRAVSLTVLGFLALSGLYIASAPREPVEAIAPLPLALNRTPVRPTAEITPLASPERIEELNLKAAHKLEEMMGVPPGTNFEELGRIGLDWLINGASTLPREKELATFYDDFGQPVGFSLVPNGEPHFNHYGKLGEPLEYPDRPYVVREVLVQDNNYLIYYGPESGYSEMVKGKEALAKFLKGFFKGSNAPFNVFHFNAVKRTEIVPLVDLGDLGAVPTSFIYGIGGGASSHARALGDPSAQPILRTDVVIASEAISSESAALRFSPDKVATGIIVNEKINWLSGQASSDMLPDEEKDESLTTGEGVASEFDPEHAASIIGEDYLGGVKVLTHVAKIAESPP